MEEEEEAGEALAVEVDMEAVGDLEADVVVAVEDTEEAATEVVVTEEAAMVVVAVGTEAVAVEEGVVTSVGRAVTSLGIVTSLEEETAAEAAAVVVAVATTAAELGISLGSVLTAVIVDFIQLFGGGFEKKKRRKSKKKSSVVLGSMFVVLMGFCNVRLLGFLD